MSEEKVNVSDTKKQALQLTVKQATKQLISEKKVFGQIHYDELTEKIASPYALDSEGIDLLIQEIEDSGISVVGDDGGNS